MPTPITPETMALVQTGAGAAGNMLNAGLGMLTSLAQLKYNKNMYLRQRRDALADWQMQADYNSPKQQMQRLREAGLNPHLVYGNGADAQMGASPRSSQVEGWNPQIPQFDLGSTVAGGIGAYYDTQIKQAQIDNLEKQGTLLDTENLMKGWNIQEIMARIPKIKVDTELGKFNLDYKSLSMQTMLQQLQANLRKTQADTQFTLDENERKAAMFAPNFQKAVLEVLQVRLQNAKTSAETDHIRQMIKNAQVDQKLKEYEAALNAIGVQKGDKTYMRWIAQYLADQQFVLTGPTVGRSALPGGSKVGSMPAGLGNQKYINKRRKF